MDVEEGAAIAALAGAGITAGAGPPQSISNSAKVRLCGYPDLPDPLGPFEVGQHEDVEQLGAGSGPEGVQPLA